MPKRQADFDADGVFSPRWAYAIRRAAKNVEKETKTLINKPNCKFQTNYDNTEIYFCLFSFLLFCAKYAAVYS